MGSTLDLKQYCVVWDWTCQCLILTTLDQGFLWTWQEKSAYCGGNLIGHIALGRGHENHLWGRNLIYFLFFFPFFLVCVVVTVSVTRQSQNYMYICFLL